ncbi:hypothetical protein EN41_19935 [Agrobacterium tumefaciens]|nr:hypothetical protein EN41_19935 [Agrobacterium tumefaciens]
MRRPRLWLLSRSSARPSLFAQITIAGAATQQEAIQGTATPITTERPTAASAAIVAQCLGLAAGKLKQI